MKVHNGKSIRLFVKKKKSIRFWTDVRHPLNKLIRLWEIVVHNKYGSSDKVLVEKECKIQNRRDSVLRNLVEQFWQYYINPVAYEADIPLWKERSIEYHADSWLQQPRT